MKEINTSLFLSDYKELLKARAEVEMLVDSIVENLTCSPGAKEQVKAILLKEQTAEVSSKLSFYEQYLIDSADEPEEEKAVEEEEMEGSAKEVNGALGYYAYER